MELFVTYIIVAVAFIVIALIVEDDGQPPVL